MAAKWWRWIILTVAAAMVAALGPLSPAGASSVDTARAVATPYMQAQRIKPAYPRLLRPYVGQKGVSWHFKKKVPAKVVRQVGKSRITKLKKYWANVAHHRYPTVLALGGGRATPVQWNGNHGYVQLKWYGLKIWMDAYMTRLVLNGLLTAGTITALLKGPYARVVALSLYFYYAGLWVCRNSKTKASTVYVLAAPPFTGVPSVLFCNPFN